MRFCKSLIQFYFNFLRQGYQICSCNEVLTFLGFSLYPPLFYLNSPFKNKLNSQKIVYFLDYVKKGGMGFQLSGTPFWGGGGGEESPFLLRLENVFITWVFVYILICAPNLAIVLNYMNEWGHSKDRIDRAGHVKSGHRNNEDVVNENWIG